MPGTKYFRAPSTIFFITTFAVAVFAAFGTERLLAGRFSTRYVYGWLIGATIVAVFALAGGFGVLAQNIADPRFADRIDGGAADLKVGALRSLLFVGLTCATILMLSRRKIAPRIAGWALVALVVVDLWSIERMYWEFSEPAKTLYATDTTIEFLRKLNQPYRVFAFGATGLPMSENDPNLDFDGLMVHGVRVVAGYHGNEIGRYDQFLTQEMNPLTNPTIWSLLNTEFLLVNSDSVPFVGVRRIVGPVKDAAGSLVSLFQMPGDHSFAWVAPVMIKYPDAAVVEAFKSPNFPAHSAAIFDTSSKVQAAQVTTLPAPLTTTTHVDSYAPGHIAMTLGAPAPKGSALVVSENYYPGWRATIDGKPATVERADLSLMGIPLPEGAKKVELEFSSDTYKEGKAITLAALLVAIAAVLAGAFVPVPKERAA